jgi:hypothetical protein
MNASSTTTSPARIEKFTHEDIWFEADGDMGLKYDGTTEVGAVMGVLVSTAPV